jgi:Ssp1 endopeptidase immunity protein Rap1a
VGTNRILIIMAIFLLIPITVSAERLNSGFDVYHNIKKLDNPQTPDDFFDGAYITGYLLGIIDGIVIMQDGIFNTMFPRELMTEKERTKISKDLRFYRLNIPSPGIQVGQLMLIFKKYAEKYPETLNESARICVFSAIRDAYGWK